MATVAIDIRVIGRNRTGDETVFFELVKKLLTEHPEHCYVLLTDKSESELVTVQERLDLMSPKENVELINFGPRNRFWWNALTLPLFFLKRPDIEVFHTQYILPFCVPSRISVVAHIHDISFARYPEYISKSDLFFLRLFIPHTLKRAFIISPSEFTKTEIEVVYHVEAQRITVVPNALGADFEQGIKAGNSDSNVHVKYALPEKYLLYVGTLQPRKNIPYLLRILKELKLRGETFQDTKLVLVGNRNAHHFDSAIDTTIEELSLENEVIFPGYVDQDDMPILYQKAAAFVFPSMYEGFGIPLLEALAAGTPTFASDIRVHREIGAERVTYFPLNDVAEAAKILYTIPVKHSTLDASRIDSRETENDYSWSRSAHILANLYQQVKQ